MKEQKDQIISTTTCPEVALKINKAFFVKGEQLIVSISYKSTFVGDIDIRLTDLAGNDIYMQPADVQPTNQVNINDNIVIVTLVFWVDDKIKPDTYEMVLVYGEIILDMLTIEVLDEEEAYYMENFYAGEEINKKIGHLLLNGIYDEALSLVTIATNYYIKSNSYLLAGMLLANVSSHLINRGFYMGVDQLLGQAEKIYQHCSDNSGLARIANLKKIYESHGNRLMICESVNTEGKTSSINNILNGFQPHTPDIIYTLPFRLDVFRSYQNTYYNNIFYRAAENPSELEMITDLLKGYRDKYGKAFKNILMFNQNEQTIGSSSEVMIKQSEIKDIHLNFEKHYDLYCDTLKPLRELDLLTHKLILWIAHTVTSKYTHIVGEYCSVFLSIRHNQNDFELDIGFVDYESHQGSVKLNDWYNDMSDFVNAVIGIKMASIKKVRSNQMPEKQKIVYKELLENANVEAISG